MELKLMVLLASIGICRTNESEKSNVLFVVVDDLRPAFRAYDDPNAYTPNFDRLAQKSVLFRNAFAQQAVCAPSRNSFLTSRRPDSLQLYDFFSYWRDTVGNYTTLPQHFKQNCYYTYSIGKVFHPGISSNHTDDYPLSWSMKPYHPPSEVNKNAKVCLNHDGSKGRNLVCPILQIDEPTETLPDIEILSEALDFLKYKDKITNGKPYFLAVGFHKPHIPLKYPRKYLKYHPIDNIQIPTNYHRPAFLPNVAWNPWIDVRSRDDINYLNISFPFGEMPTEYTRKIIQSYAAATTYIDDLFGELIKCLDNNTIIVVLGDHGVSMGEHGEFSKYSNFDVATRVPLLMHIPGFNEKPLVVEDMVELVDVFPTLVDLTNVSSSLETCNKNDCNSILCTEGRSLVPLMNNLNHKVDRTTKSVAFSQYPRPGAYPTCRPSSDEPKLKEIKIMGYSIRTDEFRFTDWVEFNNKIFKPNWTNVFGTELYHHLTDPSENLNLASRPCLHGMVRNLRKQLRAGWKTDDGLCNQV